METFPQIVITGNQKKGLITARELLYKKINNQTLLLLSGGSTPRDLYQTLAREEKIKSKAVGMVDERADGSNEKMIRETGFITYLRKNKIPFHAILRLHPKGVASDIVANYDKKIRSLIKLSKNKIAIMGIGEDGHTAGLPASPRGEPPGISNFQFPISNKEDFVVDVDNFPGEFRKRITLTFKALAKMDLLIVLAFGSAKKNALKLMFEKGKLSDVPARFYTKPEIAKKTILITDQKV